MHAIRIENLTRRYGTRRGIENVDLSVPEGSLYGFLGPNGAGKTTTIRVLIGLLRPTGGHARIFDRDCWRAGPVIRREVGYVPGDLRLPGWMSTLDGLRTFGAVRATNLEPEGRRLSERLGLDPAVRVGRMSRGMRQKCGLVLAMAHSPRLLILDEPTGGLDPLVQDEFRDLLRERRQAGCTIFFSSHTLSDVEQLCSRVAIVRDGRIVADQALDDLRRSAGHEVWIRWRTPEDCAAGSPPRPLTLHARTAREWSGAAVGPIESLLEFLYENRARIEDYSVSRPDLESLFRRYYSAETAGRTGATGEMGGPA